MPTTEKIMNDRRHGQANFPAQSTVWDLQAWPARVTRGCAYLCGGPQREPEAARNYQPHSETWALSCEAVCDTMD
jgi:hypothetical protein